MERIHMLFEGDEIGTDSLVRNEEGLVTPIYRIMDYPRGRTLHPSRVTQKGRTRGEEGGAGGTFTDLSMAGGVVIKTFPTKTIRRK